MTGDKTQQPGPST